ncbi:MAG: GNAT family N-acetyltransferase [Candidatus Izemoplasmatales bacterium]
MKIVEYSPKYAGSVADMWNKSSSSWGNHDELSTEQDVLDSERNSGNLKLYLALENDEVVGYCSLSEYKQDEGASYLPLINVRPDYHGKKIGKALILKILDEAKKTKWPRLDLYTWSGNIKAMPLYKKCGFFWERRNNTVHLMNFIPYVCQTEALNQYTEQLDLYKDSVREIDMEYDGHEENGFDIYYYQFKNDSTYLNLGFEKTSRGLVYIDTPDYEVRLTIPKHKLVYDKSYQSTLKITNKKDSDLKIEVEGVNNKNIIHSYSESFTVKDSIEINSSFLVDTFNKTQDLGKTHPSLELDLFINGKKAKMKCGILPKSPIEISLKVDEYLHRKEKTYFAYLNLENNLDKDETFDIHLPKTLIDYKEDINIFLKKEEKRSLKIPYTVKDFGYYKEEASIQYGQNIFKKLVKGIFKGHKEEFISELDNQILLVSGNSIITYQKDSKNITFANTSEFNANLSFMTPKIGLPYSLEFNNKEPEIEYKSDNQMVLSFESHSFKKVFLNVHIQNRFGLIEVAYELVNKGEKKVLSLSIPIMISASNSVIPFQNRLLKIGGSDGYIGNISSSKVDENWIYNDQMKQGFSWPDDIEMKVSDWHLSFDLEGINLDKNHTYKTKPFIVSYVHPTLKDFRKFMVSKEDKQSLEYLELKINKDNPFVKGPVDAKLISHRKAQIEGTITNNQSTYDIKDTFKVNAGLQNFKIELKDRIIEENRYLFKPSGQVTMVEKDGIYSVDNGLLAYKADINHSDSVFSLSFNQHEWIDANYPDPQERAWWASFVGGFAQRIHGIQDIVAIQEDRDMDFVELRDNFNNLWQGLKISTHYESDPVLKGISTINYILTMPGLPLIYRFTNVVNKSGSVLLHRNMHRRYIFNLDDSKGHIRFKHKDTTYKIGDQMIEIKMDNFISIESLRKHNIVIYSPKNDLIFESHKDYILAVSVKDMTVPDQESKMFEGEFLLFTQENIKEKDLRMMNHIGFGLEEK